MNGRATQFTTIVSALVLLANCACVRGELASVKLDMVPPSPTTNTFDATLELAGSGLVLMDTDSGEVSGNLLVDLLIDFDPGTHAVNSIDGLEFTGGAISFTDLSYELAMGTARADFALVDLGATMDTPAPFGAVVAGNFDAADHMLIVNEGKLLLTSYPPPSGLPVTVQLWDFSTDPMSAPPQGPGSIVASLAGIVGDQATYDVTLTAPMDLEMTIMTLGAETAKLITSGALQATGQFTRTIPEPATVLLLGLGSLALLRRRRAG